MKIKKTIDMMFRICTLTTLFVFSLLLTGWSQEPRYEKAMIKNIEQLDSAITKGGFNELANNFERIASAEKDQWLPYYYAAYSQVMYAYTQQDLSKIDPIATKATDLINQAKVLAEGANSEIYVIESMIASALISVDPNVRWVQYGKTSLVSMQKAQAADPTNPRAFYLEAISLCISPPEFGGDRAKSVEMLNRVMTMHDEFKPASAIHPTWGVLGTQLYLQQCGSEVN